MVVITTRPKLMAAITFPELEYSGSGILMFFFSMASFDLGRDSNEWDAKVQDVSWFFCKYIPWYL